MWVWLHRKLLMTFITITFYILMYPVSANIQSSISDSKKSSVPHLGGKMSSIHEENHDTTRDIAQPKETYISQPPKGNSSLSDKMKDFMNFIDFRARGNWAGSKKNEESKVIVDLDQAKVDVLGEEPKEAAFFTKETIEEGMIVDIPKSSLFREKRSDPSKRDRKEGKKKSLKELRLFYKTSTAGFRYNQRLFRTTKFWNKVYKAVLSPLKKIAIETKHRVHKPKHNKRSYGYIKPVGILNIGGQNIPRICHATHYENQITHIPKGYLKKYKKIPTKSMVVPFEKWDRRSTIGPLHTLKKKDEISEAALFEILNKLIQDSTDNKTVDNLEINIPSPRSVVHITGPMEATHHRNKHKGTRSSHTAPPDFNVAVIIAKIFHDQEHNSSTATFISNPNSVPTLSKYRYGIRPHSMRPFSKNRTNGRITKANFEVEKKSREKCPRNGMDATSTTDPGIDKCKMEKIHESRLPQKNSKEALNSLLKQIIRHVSVALDSVTTSKEFLDLIACETMNSATESVTCNTESQAKKDCTVDSCTQTCATSQSSSTQTSVFSTAGISTQNSRMGLPECSEIKSTSDPCKMPNTTNIECENTTTSPECSIYLEDEDDYCEPFNLSGYSPFLILPVVGNVVEDYQKPSYKIKKINIASPFEKKGNRKNKVSIGTEDLRDPGVYEAMELMKGLERYHTMLKNPVVTRIWPFFEVTTRSCTELSWCPTNEPKKRNSEMNRYMQDGSKLINKNFNEHEGDLKSHKIKVNSIIENIFYKLITPDKSNANGFGIKKQDSTKKFKDDGPENMRIREPARIKKKKHSENDDEFTFTDKMPTANDWEDNNFLVPLVNDENIPHKFYWPTDKIRNRGLTLAISECPSTTSYHLADLPSTPLSRG